MLRISIFFVFTVLLAILHYSMYTWTNTLTQIDCKCSDSVIRNILNAIALIFLIMIPYRIYNYKDGFYQSYFKTFIFLLSIIYYSLIIYYIDKLNKTACECSDSWKKDYSFITSILFLSLIILLIIAKLVLFSRINNK